MLQSEDPACPHRQDHADGLAQDPARERARIWPKPESEILTGSMKDRMALAMIESAAADGTLPPAAPSSNTPAAAPACPCPWSARLKSYPRHVVTSDAFAREKLEHMKILGAQLQVLPSESGARRETHPRHDRGRPHRRAGNRRLLDRSDEQPGSDRRLSRDGRGDLEPDRRGRSMASSRASGTAASLRGIGEALRRRNDRIRVLAVEPAESPYLCRAAGRAPT